MEKQIILKYLIIVIMIFSCFNFAGADFEITEIMYDLDGTDTNREWIEVKNKGDKSEDLSKWYLFSDNTKHTLTPQSESIIPSGSYVVIVQNTSQFKNDLPSFTGILFDSSWTGLKNTGESISLKNPKLEIISPIVFSSNQGGAGDGYSLQKIDGIWVGSKPTPGTMNILTKKPMVINNNSTSTDHSSLKVLEEKISDSDAVKDSNISGVNEEIINLNEIKTGTPKNIIDIPITIYPFVGLAVVIAIGIISFLIIKKRESKINGSDKQITADDIAIIE